MLNETLVSVCIPAYNHAPFVQETIKSIINQTYKKLELIIVDDGSTDQTFSKIKDLEKKCQDRFNKFILIKNQHYGTCESLNKLISLAMGDFIYIIASDDVAKPDAIKILTQALTIHPEYVLAVGDNELINSYSKQIGWDEHQNSVPIEKAYYKTFGDFLQKKHPNIDFNTNDFGAYKNLIKSNHIPNGYLISSKALKKINTFTNRAPLEDWYLMLQLSKLGKFKFVNKVLFSYRWHDNNTAKKCYYMREISTKTLQYEKRLVCIDSNPIWNMIFDQQTKKIKMKLNFKFLKFYKIQDIFKYQYILQIANTKFIVKEKSFIK